jgi:hypothetical protein
VNRIISDVTVTDVRILNPKHAYLLAFQSEAMSEIQNSLKLFSHQSIDSLAGTIEFIENQFGLGRETSNPLQNILRELIEDAFDASVHYLNPNYKVDQNSSSDAQNKLLIPEAINIEKNNPHVMKFYISMAKTKTQEEDKEKKIKAEYKVTSIKFIISYPEISNQDRLKLQRTLQLHERLKNNNQSLSDYLSSDENNAEIESFEFNTLQRLKKIHSYWQNEAKLSYEFLEKETRTNLVIKTRE